MSPRLYVALTVFAGLAFAGCGGTNVTPGASAASAAAAIHRGAPAIRVKHDKASYKKALYVLNASANAVQVFTNTYYRQLGAITNGISTPESMTIDGQGNLYVTNDDPPYSNIAEYAPGATSPTFTYNASQPAGVAVDRHGNVFVADYSNYAGVVKQYAQGIKNPIASCSAASSTYGVAVDTNGNVFVSAWYGDYAASILEFSGGLSNCSPTRLISFGNAYLPPLSLALDSNDNLIFPLGSSVDVIDPPYSAVTTTIGSGFSSVSGVSLNKKNKLLFVSDTGTNKVTVINYQTDTTVKQLGLPNGISQASAVVDAPNAVY